jgi:Arylsulfotransferase (ASST)
VITALGLAACTAGTPPSSGVSSSAAADSAGTVSVYPTPGSRTASPETQISIRGVAPTAIGAISVTGSVSGAHSGSLKPDSDGRGASYYLAGPLTPGEDVTVSTQLPITGSDHGRYSFTVSSPVNQTAGPGAETGGNTAVQSFASAPSLQPPKITVQTNKVSTAGGDFFIAPKGGPGQDGPMIVSPDGQVVWSDPLPDGQRAYDFTEQTYLGQPVLTWWQGYDTPTGTGLGQGEIYSDTYQPVATVKAGNGYHADLHDFTLTSDDTALITAYQPVTWNTAGSGGTRDGVVLDSILQEIDIPTGNVLDEWHSLDHVPLDDSYATASGSAPFDYFHINSLDKASNGDLLVSSRATHAIYDLDPSTGNIIWRLGGKQSSFTGDGAGINSQHDAKWLGPTTLSVFDNGSGIGPHTQTRSRALIIDLDLDAHTATVAQADTSPTVPQATSQGDAQPVTGGDVVVGWGAEPYYSEFASDGSLIYQAQLPTGDSSYRAYRFAWSGHPLTAPTAVASSNGDQTTVDVSWNGATGVASWRVLAGARSSDLTTSATAPSTGFQTAITLASQPRVIRVEALDPTGHVLGTTDTVTPAS